MKVGASLFSRDSGNGEIVGSHGGVCKVSSGYCETRRMVNTCNKTDNMASSVH